ncbi:unnamed protein product [Hermetia illucens]|uniref:Solute carrier family 25 member 35 n=1 Tax=Hermetia illucens TaxID=343691 RepID=A0A7R8V796_HERIL|nr:solute carrier family 25 member 35-like [Hermetia illucens]CAD7093734.1 unnamed protein product [Hermetia illucens]
MNYTNYIAGGLASVGATIFTNPLDVIKTRIQLQGELTARGTYVKPYRGTLQAFLTVAEKDGVLALQKGLVPAICFQFILNFFRLGTFSTAGERGWCTDQQGRPSFLRGMFWGAAGGALGSYISSPFSLVKTRMQAQAVESIAVGHQHNHAGMMNAFRDIYSTDGVKGLWRGAVAVIPKAILASGIQLATFTTTKDFLKHNNLVTNPTFNSFIGGFVAGTAMSLALTPPEVILTRLYNQGINEKGQGLYYRGMIDCLWKIWSVEGIHGLYKGFWPSYIRVGPHSTLVLVFYDKIIAAKDRFWNDNEK